MIINDKLKYIAPQDPQLLHLQETFESQLSEHLDSFLSLLVLLRLRESLQAILIKILFQIQFLLKPGIMEETSTINVSIRRLNEEQVHLAIAETVGYLYCFFFFLFEESCI